VRSLGLAGVLVAALLALPATAGAQTRCAAGQTAMPRKPPAGVLAPGNCVANSVVMQNQALQARDKVSCPNTLKYNPKRPGGRMCVYWDEPD
jgi:hypothetical protein